MKHKILSYLVPVIMFFSLSCGSSVRTLNIEFLCSEDCNNRNAVVIKIYQLKNDDRFRNANFQSFVMNPEGYLADDLIPNSKYERTMIPGESFQLRDVEIKSEAVYLGIMGDFHSPSQDGWQQIIDLAEDLENIAVIISENFLSIRKTD
jgi:type VI secretion system VasD/TssJ family lipoprotein